MPDDAPKLINRLLPEDEYTHTPDAASNYNESMYFNVFDAKTQVGGWFRIGNRPNEGYAEMSVCLYLPGGRVGFMFARPKISNNDELNAGGLRVEVVEPFKTLRVTYKGKVCLLERPFEMANPSKAFRENPQVDCEVSLDYEGVSPMYGGEQVREDGKPRNDIDPSKSFAKAHYEQHVAAKGVFVVDGQTYAIDGHGLRDKSWGPRFWSAINWYRWCPLNFGRDFGMMLSVVTGESTPREGGMVFRDGVYDLIVECKMDTDWDENGYQTGLRAKVKTKAGKAYEVEGKVISLIPLRNRRTTPDGAELNTRITEGFTEYRCEGLVGYGLSEYLDQIVDGRPSGMGA
jgi:hypothetical protein